MRSRLTVADGTTGLRTDVFVEGDAAAPAADLLAPLVQALALGGMPTVDGVPLVPGAAAGSVLREGVVLEYGGGSAHLLGGEHTVLRVLSGPDAGTVVPLRPGAAIDIGRRATGGLRLDDPDVSRLHATVTAGTEHVELVDRDSSNGVFVDGVAITGPHRLREGETVQIGGSRIVLERPARARAVLEPTGDGGLLVNRRYPDRRAPFDPPAVTLPALPPEDDARGLPVLAMALPAVLSVVLALVLQSPIYLLFGLMSPLLVGGNWWTDRRRRVTREARRDGSYGEALRAATAQVEQAVADEDADTHARRPDPGTVARIALTPRVELWARRPREDGWLELRLGTADRPARVQVGGPRPEGWADPVLRRAPAAVDLEAAGVLGLAGPAEWVQDRLDWVLVQCATLHSPDELQIAVLAPECAEDELGWVRWLPHARDTAGSVLAGWDAEGVDGLLRGLTQELDRRADAARQHRATSYRALLVVLAGAGALARRPTVADLLTRGPALGVRLVCTEADDRLLPDACRAVLVGDAHRAELRVDRGGQQVIVADALPRGTAERVARRLAPLRRAGDTPAGGLPDAVRFTELTPTVTADGVRAAWRLEPERTAVAVGRDADGPALLDIARDGPHAIVAGTSGAGKSELLQTWVAALAVASTPERLSVVFVDYKGGSAFKDLIALPHVVGSVTNLDERLAARALASLRAELRRRQEQLAAAGAGDRPDYLRRAALDPALPPFPRLLIVVDELAEMKERLPELVDGLVAVARIGRSLGVHLVLATQKPAGVVDGQIRANADLRICLRTANPSESMDVIETGDAAEIPKDRPGRAVVVRGGAGAAVVQTARITTPVSAGDTAEPRAVPMRWDDVAAPAPRRAESAGLRTDLDVLVDAVVAAARADGLVAPFRPWTDPLPAVVALDDLPTVPLALGLGLCDRPDQQRREPLAVPLGSGHLVVIGSGRTGRTAALRAVAAGLARGAGPDAVHLHAVDGAGGLAGLVALPHTGVVVDPDDGERLERLLVRLLSEVRDRRRRMAEHGASVVGELPEPPPQIVLLVDGWTGLTESVDTGAATAMHELLGGGSSAAGVTVCLAGDERLLKGRVLGRIDHRLCLRLNNPSDATLLGLDIRNLPAGLPPGRALWAADGCEVQLPLLVSDPSGPAQSAALAALGRDLHARYTVVDPGVAPLRLDPLPVRIGLEPVLQMGPVPPRSLLLGISGDRLAPVWADLDGPGHVVVTGPGRSGRSSALAALAAAAVHSGLRVVLVAPRQGPAHRAAAERGVLVCGPAELPAADLDLVVVDDIDVVSWDDAVVERLVGGPRLVVGALLDAFGFGSAGLVKAVRRSIGPVILLSPPNHLVADNVGVKIDRTAAFNGPPGRAFLSVGGEVLLGQVADPTA